MEVGIFTMNGGHGTMSPSYALADYLNKNNCHAVVLDIMAEANPLGEMLGNVYNSLLRKSIFLAASYMEFAQTMPVDRFPPFNVLSYSRIEEIIKRNKFDAIVMICPWITRMIIPTVNKRLKKTGIRPRLFIDVVDLGEEMPLSWINNDADYTFLATSNAMNYLSSHGLEANKANIMGVPLNSEFSKGAVTKVERIKARIKYNLKEDAKVVTILGGREGVSNTRKILLELVDKLKGVEFMVQCGNNEKLYSIIENIAKNRTNVRIVGFVESIRELYSISDVVITKAGAITVSELIVSQVPFILDTWPVIMPQEWGNVKFVEENKLAPVTHRINELPKMVEKILNSEAKFSKKKRSKQSSLRSALYGTEKIGDFIISSIKNEEKSRAR